MKAQLVSFQIRRSPVVPAANVAFILDIVVFIPVRFDIATIRCRPTALDATINVGIAGETRPAQVSRRPVDTCRVDGDLTRLPKAVAIRWSRLALSKKPHR